MTTTLSFRADDRLAESLENEVSRSGSTRSEVLAAALRAYLYRLACERDADLYEKLPLTVVEQGEWVTETWLDDKVGTDWNEVFGV